MTNFTLLPFTKSDDIEIHGTIKHTGNLLHIDYKLVANSNVIFPEKSIIPLRKDDLWQTTCFEFFIAKQGNSEYWEFNVSPSGNWNVYYFESYRQGMKEFSIDSLPFSIAQPAPEIFTLSVAVDLKKIMPENMKLESLDIAITTVVEDTDHQLSYWALKHCGEEADFHNRDGFVSLSEVIG